MKKITFAVALVLSLLGVSVWAHHTTNIQGDNWVCQTGCQWYINGSGVAVVWDMSGIQPFIISREQIITDHVESEK